MPGKVMRPILGKPMIIRQIERIRKSTLVDEVVVATSVHPSDDLLVELLEAERVLVRRGSLDDVLIRFIEVIEEFEPTLVVRLTGDNPLVDPDVIDMMIRESDLSGADCVSNSLRRTFPYGLDVECVVPSALRRLISHDLTTSEREHVTLGVYARPDEFRIHQVTQNPDLSQLRWTVDYPEDFAYIEQIYSALYVSGAVFGQDAVLKLIDQRPELRRTMADVS